MKTPLSLAAAALFPFSAEAQYVPADTYFSRGGPAYAPVPQADNVTVANPALLTASAYQWWAHNIPNGAGPRNAPGARLALGDLPPVAYELADLRLLWAWTFNGPTGGRISGLGVKVAIVDDGIQRTHSDLLNAADLNAATHFNFFTNINSPDPGDPSNDSHGTSLAGIVGARHGTIGMAGTAPRSTLQGIVALKGFVDDFDWASAFAHGTTFTDTDGDQDWLDEVRTGSPFCHVCLNASFNFADGDAIDLYPEDVLWQRAIRHGATQGRAGKGVVYVTSAGNGADGHMNTNYVEQKNSIFQIPVTAVSDLGRRVAYANVGANIVCAAPSWGHELPPAFNWPARPAGFPTNRPFFKSAPVEPDEVPFQWRRITQGVPTIRTQNGFDFNFNGTGASAAQVAGVVALLLEMRPDLTARDVKEILLRSCRVVNDVRHDLSNQPLPYEPNGPGSAPPPVYPWPATGPHPPVTIGEGPTQWRMGPLGRPLHHALGAGLLDAHLALRIAERWVLLPANPYPPVPLDVIAPGFGESITARRTETGGVYIPVTSGALIPTSGAALEITLPQPPAGMRVEHVEVRVRLYHKRRGDLEIKLIAPAELAWDGAGRTLVSDLFVPHREDYTESRWHATDPALRDPTDWTFSTVRHWGTVAPITGGGVWKVRIRDAINKGATTTTTANDPVFVPVVNPTDAQSQRVEGVGITWHGTNTSTQTGNTAAWDAPVITSSAFATTPSPDVQSFPLQVQTPAAAADGQPAFPVTSWDFFHLPDIVPVQAAAPAQSPFEYYPPGTNATPRVPPLTALYPAFADWPAVPAWVPLTTPPAQAGASSGALVSRPRGVELSSDGRFLVLRDPANADPLRNFIHVRLHRAGGVLDLIPWHPGSYNIRVLAESLIGISQPRLLTVTVSASQAAYGGWRYANFPPAEFSDPAISGPGADPDQDGYDNRLEHYFQSDPRQPSAARLPTAGSLLLNRRLYATLTFTRRADIAGATGSVQFGKDLQTWNLPAILLSTTSHADGTVTESWRSSNPPGERTVRVFGRVVVTAQP